MFLVGQSIATRLEKQTMPNSKAITKTTQMYNAAGFTSESSKHPNQLKNKEWLNIGSRIYAGLTNQVIARPFWMFMARGRGVMRN